MFQFEGYKRRENEYNSIRKPRNKIISTVIVLNQLQNRNEQQE